MNKLLRTTVLISYEGQDITRDVASDLLSFTYTDNEGGKADDISIRLKNDHGRWSGPWLPVKGDKINVTIIQDGTGAGPNLPCGTFTIDEIEVSGPPSIVDIKGASTPSQSGITRNRRSRAWENVRLSEIVQDVAREGELSVMYMIEEDPYYDRRDQRDESDLAFLKRLCDDEGFNLKCTDNKLVVFDPRKQSGEPPVGTISVGESSVISYRFSAQTYDVYARCTVEYVDPETGSLVQYTYEHPDIGDGKTLKLVKRAENIAEAERRAKAALYRANRAEKTGSVELVGNTMFSAGTVIEVKGIGNFSGLYYIEAATHNIGAGYRMTLDLTNARVD